MRENATSRAHRLLTEGRVDVAYRDRWQLLARVRGDHGVEYVVRWSSGTGWVCGCAAAGFRAGCAHVAAVQLVTVINRPIAIKENP